MKSLVFPTFARFALALILVAVAGCTGTETPDCTDVVCPARGSCAVVEDVPTCLCETGYTGEDCASCDTGYHDEDGKLIHTSNAATNLQGYYEACEAAGLPRPSGILR